MAEETIFEDSTVSITTARLIINGTTYALRNITSVKMSTTVIPAQQGCAVMLIGFGAIVGITMLPLLSGKTAGDAFVGLLIAGGMIFGGVKWRRHAKQTQSTPDYHVTIASSSGQSHALTSKDPGYIEKVVASINDAIVKANRSANNQ